MSAASGGGGAERKNCQTATQTAESALKIHSPGEEREEINESVGRPPATVPTASPETNEEDEEDEEDDEEDAVFSK
ncbi:hypothetical protein EYF80_060635 [Liparis tanakae]|uniref:Uncharacterized protein n=1 Tax=Liparis tanakae TaxID=230148 RepID=A0A4Z2EJV9_9TELE|nr:hypothetical protein EYF80_060635 [Liparis tanakae]